MPNEFIVVVSGLPRSGTSLMMQMLAAGGIPPLTDEIRGPDENNPRGYLEFEPVKKLRSNQSWLPRAQGHAVKIIHILLRELPADGSYRYRVILMKRPLPEILASQRTMLAREGKPSADETMLAKIYATQFAQVEKWLGAQPMFSFLPVKYHDILNEPRVVVAKIDAFLGGGLAVDEMVQAVDPALYRQRKKG